MGYDNECIVNIRSLPGEYFCPVCRTLVYPNGALQAQCTHLYCKPCLTYVVATSHDCPYDGYLVTEADSKPLVESSKELDETIGKAAVHCLYHRSGCQWQGSLAESTGHGAECNYGSSPVVCNRCGAQIIHHQVQEHVQICPGIQPQGQVAEAMQSQAVPAANQAASQDPLSAVNSRSNCCTGFNVSSFSTRYGSTRICSCCFGSSTGSNPRAIPAAANAISTILSAVSWLQET